MSDQNTNQISSNVSFAGGRTIAQLEAENQRLTSELEAAKAERDRALEWSRAWSATDLAKQRDALREGLKQCVGGLNDTLDALGSLAAACAISGMPHRVYAGHGYFGKKALSAAQALLSVAAPGEPKPAIKISTLELVREFHQKFSVSIRDKPSIPARDRVKLREDLIKEEYEEFVKASEEGDLVEIADALADLKYVIDGTALEYGIPLDAISAEVHRSNMSKLWADGKPRYREDGKVLKPPTYSKADIAGLLKLTDPDSPTGTADDAMRASPIQE